MRFASYKIFLLYFFLAAGGLWHILGWFQTLMQIVSGPLMVFLGLWLVYELQYQFQKGQRRRFYYWIAIVFFTGFLAEVIGIKTGLIFGMYVYGPVLQPQLLGVPLAIGFAWVSMTLGAGSIAYVLVDRWLKKSLLFYAMIVGLIMVVFDIFMEPAAVNLNYWAWTGNQIPLQNYLAWFVLGWGLAYLGLRWGLFENKKSFLACHIYLAQVFYFIMVYFK